MHFEKSWGENSGGYKRYLLVLIPNPELSQRIGTAKKEFCHLYKVPVAFNGKVNIPLISFLQKELSEEKIYKSLKQIAMASGPFKVELNGFGSLPSHTIYIKVESQQTIKNFIKEIKSVQQVMKAGKENKPYFIENPFIPVARRLLPWQYEKGWLDYRNRDFTGRFMADSVFLLKQPSEGKPFQMCQRFELLNLSVGIKQGELFI